MNGAKDGLKASFTEMLIYLRPFFVLLGSPKSALLAMLVGRWCILSPFTLTNRNSEPSALVAGACPLRGVSGANRRPGTLQNTAIMVIVASNTAQVWQSLMCSSPLPRSCGLCNSYTELGKEGCTRWFLDPSPPEHLLDLAALNGRTIQQHRTHVHVQFKQHIADCFQYPRSLVDVVTKEPCSLAIPGPGIEPCRRLRHLTI